MQPKQELLHKRLLEIIDYDPDSGLFTWISAGPRNPRKGQLAGRQHGDGSWTITINQRHYRAHRLAWFYVYGAWPAADIDHINGDPMDNRIVNLRDVPHQVNMQNRQGAARHSKTGVLGVAPHRDKFAAWVKTDGKVKHLGLFPSVELAHAARLSAQRELYAGNTI